MTNCLFHPTPIADIIYINGRLITLDESGSIAEAIAVQDGKILAVGSNEEIKRTQGETTKVVDLEGKTIIPGIIDSHTHASLLMKVRNDYVDVHYSTAPDIPAVLKQLADRVKDTPKGEWVFAVGSGASAEYWTEQRLPTKEELDSVSTEHPIIVLAGMHVAVINSKAIEVVGLEPGKEYQHGSHIFLDENGNPDGGIGEPIGIFPDLIYDEETCKLNLTKRIPDWYLKWGVTTVCDIGVPVPNYERYRKLAAEGHNSTVRLTYKVNYESTGRTLPSKDLSELALPPEADHDFWRIAGIKIWVDGEGGANPGTACITGCYHGHKDPNDHGLLNTTQEDLNRAVAHVHKSGLGMFTHDSGDKAQAMVLDAHEYALKWYGRPDLPVVLEHFGVIMGSDELFKRAAKLGAFGCIQPFWIKTFPKNTISQLGEERARKVSFRFKDMIKAGLEPAYGSDQTGTQRGDDNTLHSIELLMSRRTAEGDIFLPDQALEIDEALRVMTIWAAKALGEGHLKGSLEVGKFADMVVLSEDIHQVAKENVEKIKDIKVLETIVGGNSVYQLNS
ncbi:amidohydrolase [Vibrio maritimus]